MRRLSAPALATTLLLLAGCQQPPGSDSGTGSQPGAATGAATEPDDAQAEWTDTHQVAWDVVTSQPLATLITVNEEGQPQARLVESMPPDSGRMDVWIGTNRNSAKVRELQNNDRATLFYRSPGGSGYVTLRGRATLVDDPAEKERRWRPHWEPLFVDRETMYVLIHFEPEDGEVLSFPAELVGDSLTWAAPEFRF